MDISVTEGNYDTIWIYKMNMNMALPLEHQVLRQLGYSYTQMNTRAVLFPPNLTLDQLADIRDISDRLIVIDSEIATNVKDSMAVKVQDLTLDYAQYLREVRAQASQLLTDLSFASNLPIAFNKYTSTKARVVTTARNYY